jgi:hypothetical protein
MMLAITTERMHGKNFQRKKLPVASSKQCKLRAGTMQSWPHKLEHAKVFFKKKNKREVANELKNRGF